jgi:alpha-galactosidase
VHGVVSTDRSEAIFAYVALATSAAEVPEPARLPGLDPAVDYAIEVVDTGGHPFVRQAAPPGWTDSHAAVPGSFLGEVGLPMPVLGPEQALVLHLRAT